MVGWKKQAPGKKGVQAPDKKGEQAQKGKAGQSKDEGSASSSRKRPADPEAGPGVAHWGPELVFEGQGRLIAAEIDDISSEFQCSASYRARKQLGKGRRLTV